MKNAIWLALLALALSGCASTSSGGRDMKSCDTPDVKVYVVGGAITLDPDPVEVCKENVKIRWVIDTSDPSQRRYEFRANSIELKYGDPDDEFENCKPGKGGEVGSGNKDIRCHDKNKKHTGRDYLYTIRVYEIGSGIPIVKDPTIVNY